MAIKITRDHDRDLWRIVVAESSCGAGSPGGKGFRQGNTCGSKKSRQAANNIVTRLRSDGGFTYQPIDDVSPTEGFAIAAFPDVELIVDESLSDDELEKKIEDFLFENWDSFGDSDVNAGGWIDDGKIYLDLSIVHPDNGDDRVEMEIKGGGTAMVPRAARDLAIKHDQLSIYDLKNQVEILVESERRKKKRVEESYAEKRQERNAGSGQAKEGRDQAGSCATSRQAASEGSEIRLKRKEDRWVVEAKSTCGANAKGGGGFQRGNTCGSEGDGPSSSGRSDLGSDWFKQEEIESVKTVHTTPYRDEPSAYSAANEVLDRSEDSYQAVLDLGEGLSKDIGAKVVSFDEALQDAASSDQPMVLIAPPKGKDRAREKVRDKYKGDWSRLTDIARATVIVPKVDDIKGVVDQLRSEASERGWKIRERSAVNRFVKPTAAGYRDVNILLEAPNGVLAELQINFGQMWIAKETDGHKLYEQWRTIAEKSQHSDDDRTTMKSLETRMSQLYSAAWNGVN